MNITFESGVMVAVDISGNAQITTTIGQRIDLTRAQVLDLAWLFDRLAHG